MEKNKILLVDDEADVIEFLSYNFKKYGYEVDSAKSGEEGIERVKHHPPDLIIADIMMPGMDGTVMCRILKSHDDYKHIPIIFLSAVQDDYQVMKAGLTGAEEYISKPIAFVSLLNMVEKYLPHDKSLFTHAKIAL